MPMNIVYIPHSVNLKYSVKAIYKGSFDGRIKPQSTFIKYLFLVTVILVSVSCQKVLFLFPQHSDRPGCSFSSIM